MLLCREFLDVFGKVDPGQGTDWWAVTQLEAIGAKSVLLQRDLESGKIPASAFKEALIAECQQGSGAILTSASKTIVYLKNIPY